MTKQRILFITTGGTIASVHTPQGLRPVLSSDELLAHLPELNDLCIPETLALCSIDSTNLGQVRWFHHLPRHRYAGLFRSGTFLPHPERGQAHHPHRCPAAHFQRDHRCQEEPAGQRDLRP